MNIYEFLEKIFCKNCKTKIDALKKELNNMQQKFEQEKETLKKVYDVLKQRYEKLKQQPPKTITKYVKTSLFKDLSDFDSIQNYSNHLHGRAQVVVCDKHGCQVEHYAFFNSFLCLYSDLDVLLNYAHINKPDLSAVEVFNGCLKSVQKSCGYTRDYNAWGKSDSWTSANVVQLLKRDDCESLSGLVVSAFKWYELKYGIFEDWEVFVAFGSIKINKGWYGHGFPMLIRKRWDEEKCLIGEATLSFEQEAVPVSTAKKKYRPDLHLISFPTKNNFKGIWELKNEVRWWRKI